MTLTEKVSQLPCIVTVHHIWYIPIIVISPTAMLTGPTTYWIHRYHQGGCWTKKFFSCPGFNATILYVVIIQNLKQRWMDSSALASTAQE